MKHTLGAITRLYRNERILASVLVGFPVWWALGLGSFVWILYAFPMVAVLYSNKWARVPKRFVLWMSFLLWMLASGLEISQPSQLLAFTYRAMLYSSATIFFVYCYYRLRTGMPWDYMRSFLALFWVIVVIGGWLGLLAPNLSLHSFAYLIVPAPLKSVRFVSELVTPRSAQMQYFMGYATPRPAAPFTYSNEWGSTFAILAPIALAQIWSRGKSRLLGLALAGASLLPAVLSLDRGLWLSAGFAVGIAGVYFLVRRRSKSVLIVAGLAVACVIIIGVTPLGSVALQRLRTPHSNTTRILLTKSAIDSFLASPILGHGAPVSADIPGRVLPAVGTHGQIWLLLVSHGILATVSFALWFGLASLARRRERSGLDSFFPERLSLLVALLQMGFYSLLPTQLFLMMIISATLLGAPAAPREVSRRQAMDGQFSSPHSFGTATSPFIWPPLG